MTIESVMPSIEGIDDSGVESYVLDISPDLAQIWLGKNTSNRKLKPAVMLALSKDLKEGRWLFDGNPIRFAGSAFNPSKLLDGQNRLHAILKSGVTARSLVIFGLDEASQKTMDSGTKRTVADNLTIDGVKNAMIIAAATNLILRAEEGKLDSSFSASTARALEFISEHPELGVSATIANSFAERADVAKSIVAYTHWRFAKIDMDDATNFWRDAAEKVGLKYGDPVLALTNRFAMARRQKERVPITAQISAIFRTWNDRRLGNTKRTVAFTVNAEGLPSIK